jgi:quinol monooxygenase YgiN
MSEATQGPISLASQWFILPCFEKQVREAVKKLAADIASKEPGTLTYLVHMPWVDSGVLPSSPPSTTPSLLFFETYRDADTFKAHVQGTLFNEFVNRWSYEEDKGASRTCISRRGAALARRRRPGDEHASVNRLFTQGCEPG